MSSHTQVLIGGRSYTLAVEPGQEPHLFDVARLVDDKLAEIRSAAPDLDRDNQLILALMLLGDACLEAQNSTPSPAKPAAPGVDVAMLHDFHSKLAKRLETLARQLSAVG